MLGQGMKRAVRRSPLTRAQVLCGLAYNLVGSSMPGIQTKIRDDVRAMVRGRLASNSHVVLKGYTTTKILIENPTQNNFAESEKHPLSDQNWNPHG